jgi:hypothetical protein
MVFITKAVVKETEQKVDHQAIQKLVDQLDPTDYSDTVKNIVFFYTAMPNPRNHPEDIEFETDTNTLGLSLQLNYDQFMAASPEEALDMMKQLFLKGIDRYQELNLDFNTEQFKVDVQNIFYPEEES